MNHEKTIQNCFERLSIASSKRSFNQNHSENEVDDPISAYFKQRCESFNKINFKNKRESSSDSSSVGLIDIDNVSLFDDCERESLRLTGGSLTHKESLNSNENKQYSKASLNNLETNIKKQRVLAQKALMKFNNKTSEDHFNLPLTPEKSRESNVLSDISSRLTNSKITTGEVSKDWYQPNFCSDTPRYFKDELSSFGGEENFTTQHDSVSEKHRNSEYTKRINSMMKDISQGNRNCDIKFQSQSQEEQIRRLQEDERKFNLDNSGVLHHSNISHFSGTTGEDLPQWSHDANHQKNCQSSKNLSIGQFFNIRSNRISSLIGSGQNEKDNSNLVKDLEPKTFNEPTMNNSLPISEKGLEKRNLRRCVSTYNVQSVSDNRKFTRHSNDSSASNSTVMIQNLIAEMESGLSGTQIYEKLLNYGRNKSTEKKQKEIDIHDNNETPKSTKLPGRKEMPCRNLNEGTKMTDFARLRDLECKENNSIGVFKENQNFVSGKNENIKRLKNRKGFDASTPKLKIQKSQNKFKTTCSNISTSSQAWEPPRISAIQSMVDLNKTDLSEENDKTLTSKSANSSVGHKKSNNLLENNTLSIESTIIAGDLTIISQRIEEMKEDSVCIVRCTEQEEPILLTVIQKLANLPKGSVNCSALTPLLRDQFPELLSTLPNSLVDISHKNSFISPNPPNLQEELIFLRSGSWVKLPGKVGYSKKIMICAGVEQSICIPIKNVSKNWLLVSVENVQLSHPVEVKLSAVKNQQDWISDFFSLSMKDTLIPPNSHQALQISVTPETSAKMDFILSFILKNLLSQESQSFNLIMRVHAIDPSRHINIIPNDFINFGTIADQCSDSNIVQVSFSGVCHMPFMVHLIEDDFQSNNFTLKSVTSKSGYLYKSDCNDNQIFLEFEEGEKQVFEFRVAFQPNGILNSENKIQDFEAVLAFKINTKKETNSLFKKIPVQASVGSAKFLCCTSCVPLVFRTSDTKQSVTRSYPLKNIGLLPITFAIKIVDEKTQAEQQDNIFVAPKTFYLPKDEESEINITFNAHKAENFIKRKMIFQIKPNGRTEYEVELIGIISPSKNKPSSRTSRETAKFASGSLPVKLLTTQQTLTWPSVHLEKDVWQSLQLKNASDAPVIARLTFKKNSDAFKFINENGESVYKLRKTLKPGCPYTLTVAFRPSETGPQFNMIFVELDQTKETKMIYLCGFGGTPLLYIGNVKSDLNDHKILKLQNYCPGSEFYSNILEFKNSGRIPGFILLRPAMDVFSLKYELVVNPSSIVVAPNSVVSINVSQRLKCSDLKLLLSEKDISKLATISVIMGDEPSRLRLRRILEKGIIKPSERLKILTDSFYQEKKMDLSLFQDSPTFEQNFLKTLKIIQVAVVVEKSSDLGEPTILEDGDETVGEFVTIISASNKNLASPDHDVDLHSQKSSQPLKSKDVSAFLTDKLDPHTKITEWLDTLSSSPTIE